MSRRKNPFYFILIFVTALLNFQFAFSQSISPMFFGQNAWMPDTVGQANNCTQPPCILYGSLHNKWNKISESGAGSVRFGGIQPDRNMPTQYQYIKMIDSIRAKGMEPIIQVPYHNNRYTAAQAAALVQYINVTKSRAVKYWIIGNEPDLEYSFTTAAQVAGYIRPFASAMKAVDPTIKIVGPETSWYNTNIINGLTTPGGADDVTGTDANGRYYIDILSFHAYAYDGTQTRADMISKLTASNGYNDHLVALNARLANCNSYHSRTGLNALRSAVTEANVNWQNPSTDNLNGTGANSFIGGQFVAEMYGLGLKNNLAFINMWSVVEGNNTALNIGYIDSQTGNKKPAYYHFQMMSQNFAGNFISSTSTQTNVKIFSCQNNGTTTVMMMNEDLLNNYNYTVRLNTGTVSGTSALKVTVNAGIAQEYSNVLNNQSTVLLFFNQQGQLIKRVDYSLATQAVQNLPPVTTVFTPSLPVTSINAPVNTTPSSEQVKCSGQTALLSVNSGTNNTRWYNSLTSASVIGTGANYSMVTSNTGNTAIVQTLFAEAYNSATVSARTPVTVTVQNIPNISVNSGSICSGSSFSIAAAGANTYSYSSASPVVSPSSTSSYTVWGIGASGCMSSPAVSTVSVTSRPVISVAGGSVCSGSSFVLNPSGATSYTFSSGSATVTPAATSSYSVYGSSGNGCAALAPAIVTISVSSLPVISVANGTVCAGSSFVLNPSGASNYTFSSGSATVSPQSTSTYTIYGSNANGCVSSSPAIAVVNVSQPPVISVNSGTVCQGSSFVLTPSGATSYTFSSGTATVSPGSTTTYSVFGGNGSCISEVPATAIVTVLERPVISTNSGSICQGQSFTIQPSGALSYTVQNNGMIVSPSQSTIYLVSGTGANGCISANSASCFVNVNNGFSVGVNSGAICKGQTFTLSPWGASSYTFSGGSALVSPNSSTTYTVTGSNGGACLAYAVSTVIVNNNPQITVNSGKICPGSVFTMTPSGAETYTFSNGSPYARPESTTSYTVHGTSSKGCKSQSGAIAKVAVLPAPQVIISSGGTLNCEGSSVELKASGADNYEWSDGQTGERITLTAQGIQSISVTGITTDACQSVATIVLKSSICSGMEENAGKPEFSVYPNPFQSELNLVVANDASLQVLDISGKSLQKLELHSGNNLLQLGSLTPGVYILRVESADGVKTAKVIRR